MMDERQIKLIIERAILEDMPMGDITTDNIIPESSSTRATLIAKEDGVIAGIDVCGMVFRFFDQKVIFNKKVKDGEFINKGTVIAEIHGSTRALLKAERTALNILQRMCGIATKTYKLADEIKDTNSYVVDTRKTTPGLRILEKYAVRMGGGRNHRFCLSDGVMIKDNHIKAAGGIRQAIETARAKVPHTIKIEVETENLEQVNEALVSGADIIMLDNMDILTMKQAVDIIAGRAITEASGNVCIDNIRNIALTGVDIISVGGITHSVVAMDISMKISVD